ncbi:hypothetical protein O3M35_010781 [Rhynocoris fuscipes]|uniref:Glycoside hydrolase family 38 N-terminal domain-containing protein n=1 Tax=Rhynocoris fuscipes TaxID=488301 RepID=A0AAW1D1M9_9HEMI
MPDEASTQLFGLLNQLTEGHQWLFEEFALVPETGWSIDPFGVGSTMPYLLSASGVDKGYVIQRIHFAWKNYLGLIGALDTKWIQDFSTETENYDMPLRIQHSKTYSVGDSCGITPKLCSYYDFINLKNEITFSNIRKRVDVSF